MTFRMPRAKCRFQDGQGVAGDRPHTGVGRDRRDRAAAKRRLAIPPPGRGVRSENRRRFRACRRRRSGSNRTKYDAGRSGCRPADLRRDSDRELPRSSGCPIRVTLPAALGDGAGHHAHQIAAAKRQTGLVPAHAGTAPPSQHIPRASHKEMITLGLCQTRRFEARPALTKEFLVVILGKTFCTNFVLN